MISIAFAKTRAAATRDAQVLLTAAPINWTWHEKTALQWTTDLTVLTQLQTDEGLKRTEWRLAAETWEGDLIEIQRITREVARKGAFHFRHDAVKVRVFAALRTDGKNRQDIHDQGRAARDAWQTADAAWTFSEDVTVGSLSSLLATAQVREGTHGTKLAVWRNVAAGVMEKARSLNEESVAWYADATAQLGPDTAPGMMIRTTVPTTSRPAQPVQQAVISNLMVSGKDIHFDCAAPHATRFTYLQQTPGSPAYVVVAAESEEAHLTLHDQVPGLHRFKAFGSNAESQGPESAVTEVTVAAAAVA